MGQRTDADDDDETEDAEVDGSFALEADELIDGNDIVTVEGNRTLDADFDDEMCLLPPPPSPQMKAMEEHEVIEFGDFQLPSGGEEQEDDQQKDDQSNGTAEGVESPT